MDEAEPDVRIAGGRAGLRREVRTLKRSGGLAQLDAGTETFAEFASEWWELYAKPNLERATLSNYANVYNKHLLQRIGHMRLRDLNVPTLMRLRADLEADGVGRQAVRKSLAVLQSIQRASSGSGSGRIRRARCGSRRCGATGRSHRSRPKRLSGSGRRCSTRARTGRDDRVGARLRRRAAAAGRRAALAERPEEHAADRAGRRRRRAQGQKTNRPPRTVTLLAPLREDLAAWRTSSSPRATRCSCFPPRTAGRGEYDWRNWRRRSFRPAARAAGVEDPRPYDLRHLFASLLIHEGRHSIVEIAAQLGHNPTTCLSTYAHVIAELQEAPRVPAEQIRLARAVGRDAARRPPSRQLSLGDLGL
jgi:integrase